MTMSASVQTPRALEECSADSLRAWRRLVGSRFVALRLSGPEPFGGVLRTTVIDGTHISDIRASAHRVERRADDISMDDPEHLKLTLQLTGRGVVRQDGREAVLHQGDVAVYDTGRPYVLDYPVGMRSLVMVFPHRMLGLSAELVPSMTATRLAGDSGIGKVISPFMTHLAENLTQISGAPGVRIVRSALDLVTAMLSDELLRHHSGGESWRQLLGAAQRYIEANLDDPELSASRVAAVHYVSLRHLQYLFSHENQTVSGYIRQQRLERSRMDLQDPSLVDLSILHIAHRWGFSDASHFSRIFRAAYGASPSAYRRGLVAGETGRPVGPVLGRSDRRSA